MTDALAASGGSGPDATVPPHILPDAQFLTAVRHRAVRLASIAIAVMALLGCATFAASAVTASWAFVDLASRWRGALGFTAPASGRDWFLLCVMAATIAVPLLLLLVAYRWYRRVWNRRLRETWGGSAPSRRLEVVSARHDAPTHARHVRALLASPGWVDQWHRWSAEPPSGFPLRETPATLTADDYTGTVPSILAALDDDIADRALVAGLAVGLSRQRLLDGLSIAASALELQLHVLTKLGKKPNLRTWRTMLRYTGASLFVNHYLDREDAYAVQLGIRSAAMGFEAVAKILEETGDALGDVDIAEIVDDVSDIVGLDRAGLAATALRLLGTSAVLGTGAVVGVGQVGLHQVAELTRDLGDELLQGVLAASILYFHGMSLAVDVLALDDDHRTALTPTMRAVVPKMRDAAGRLARKQVRLLRRAYVQQRRDAYARLPAESRHALADRMARRKASGGTDEDTTRGATAP